MQFEFDTANRIIFGNGSIKQVGSVSKTSGRRAMVVCGKSADRAEPAARRPRAGTRVARASQCRDSRGACAGVPVPAAPRGAASDRPADRSAAGDAVHPVAGAHERPAPLLRGAVVCVRGNCPHRVGAARREGDHAGSARIARGGVRAELRWPPSPAWPY